MGVLAFFTLAQMNFSSNTLAANNETELVEVALISEAISAPKDRGIIGVTQVILVCQPNSNGGNLKT